MENLLEINNISKIFKIRNGFSSNILEAVANVNIKIKSNEPQIFAIAGESGSGKSTLAKILLGMEKPTNGEIFFENKNLLKLSNKERKKWFNKEIQPVFQDPFAAFNPLKKIEYYLYETIKNFNASENNSEDYIDEHLQKVGLTLAEIAGRFPHELSGGQAQRIAVARALLTKPALIIADEPVSMLDASLRISIVNMFRDLKDTQRVSIIYITHDLATAYYSADRIAIMLRGWVVEMGKVEDVLGKPLHPYTKNLMESIPKANPDEKWDKDTNLAEMDTDEYSKVGCRFAGRCPEVMDQCHNQVPDNYHMESRTVKCFKYAN